MRGQRPDVLAIGAEAGRAAGLDVDVVDLDRVGYALLKGIHRDGILVYRKDAATEASWRSRTLLVLADEPYFARMREGFLLGLAGRAKQHDGRS